MSEILAELQTLIWLNEAEQYVPNHIALSQLDEQFGDDVIPGLMECLTDEDAEVRRLAVSLLTEARPRSNVAVPKLIECLNDEHHLVQVAVLTSIGDFGEVASGAIGYLYRWLDCDHEFLRILAIRAIISIDPDRTELLPVVRPALKSDDSSVRSVAREILGKFNTTMPFDADAFQEIVWNSWMYHAPCEEIYYRAIQEMDSSWRIDAAPVFQEIFGGEDDGKLVWAGFHFHMNGFAQEPGIEFLDYGAVSQCADHEPIPFICIQGRYFGEDFFLRVGLEPLPHSVVREVLDTIKNEARPIEATDDETYE